MTMSTEETQVSTVAETQNQAADPIAQTAPEVAKPDVETQQQDTKAEASDSKEDDAEKAKRAMQRRIDKRTADLYRERAEKEQLAREVAELRGHTGAAPEQQAQQGIDPGEVERRAREIAALDKINDKANSIAQDGEKRFAGEFRAALATVTAEAGPLFDQKGKPTAVGEAILDADDPAGLLHYLHTNADLAAELDGLSPAQLGRRIGRIEAQMASKPPPKPVSRAPDPARPINGTRSSGSLADMDMDAYVAARKAQGARWAR